MTPRKGERPPVPAPLPPPARLVDTHTHLDACGARTPEQVRAALDRASAAGVDRVITVADDLTSARWVAEAVGWDRRLFGAIALHPTRTTTFTDDDRAELERLAAGDRIVAVGETGLDHYWDYAPHDAQEAAFGWHIELAKRLGKPLMIHDRDAHEDVFRVLDRHGPPPTVVFHCFSGDAAMVRRCADAGYVMSFAGPVTFRNARALRAAAAAVPRELLLVETDAPFLTPHPYRGRPNEPYCLPYTVRDLANLRGDDPVELAIATTANAQRVFGSNVSVDLVTGRDR